MSFGMGETGARGGDPYDHGENIKIHRSDLGLNPRPCCKAAVNLCSTMPTIYAKHYCDAQITNKLDYANVFINKKKSRK